MRKLGLFSVAFCLALLALMIAATGPVQLLEALGNVPPGHIIAALLAVQVQVVASAWRWRFTARRLGHDLPLTLAIREYYVSSALNLVLPGGMAGDAVRAYRSRTEGSGGWQRPAIAVVLERLSGQVALLAITLGGAIAWIGMSGDPLPAYAVWIVAGIALVLLAAVAFAMLSPRTWLPQRLRAAGSDLAAVFWRDGAWAIQAGLSTLVVGGYIAAFLIASDAIGARLPAIAAFTVIPLCLMTMMIPAGVGGWGTREAAAAALWPLLGFSSGDGIAASLLYGLLSLAGAAIPGAIAVAVSLYHGRISRA